MRKKIILFTIFCGVFQFLAIASCENYEQNIDTFKKAVIIYTDSPYMLRENTVNFIDSICNEHEQILDQMPVPELVKAKGEYLGEGLGMKFDSINELILKRGYREKIGPDTIGDVVREFYFNPRFDYLAKVRYYNVKTGQNLMLLTLGSYNATICFYLNDKLIKITSYDYYKPVLLDGGFYYQNKMDCYYLKQRLIYARLFGNGDVTFIQFTDEGFDISAGISAYFGLDIKIPKELNRKRLIRKSFKPFIKQS